MDYQKRLKIRTYCSIGYIILGIIMDCIPFIIKTENSFLQYLGTGLIVVGIARLVKQSRMKKSDTTLKEQEIKETDERNIMLAHRSRSLALSASALLMGIAVIILSFMGFTEAVKIIALILCGQVFLCWIFYIILNKKY